MFDRIKAELGEPAKEYEDVPATLLADARGLTCFLSHPRLLMLDYDEKDGHDMLKWPNMERCPEYRAILRTTSQSGRGRHYYIVLEEPLSEGDRIDAQAALGSDPVREKLSRRRLELGSRPGEEIALFETDEEAGHVYTFLEEWGIR